MRYKKALGLLLSFALLISVAVPGTLATEATEDGSEPTTVVAETETPAPTDTSEPTEASTESDPPETQPTEETVPTVEETEPTETTTGEETTPTEGTPVLTIAVTGANSGDTFLFDIRQGETAVTAVIVAGNGSVEIAGLSAGTDYTVTLRDTWSWRYEPVDSQVGSPDSTLTFTVTPKSDKQYLLSGSAYGTIGGTN